MGAFRTPLIDKLKTDTATFYTFGSPIEDIGLNINERSNKVALSHYVLLNLPGISSGMSGTGNINTDNFDEKLKTEGDKNWVLPKILQNYALNFETMLRNRTAYDYSATKTVTERVFWKMLQKSGAVNFLKYQGSDNEIYYHEDFSDPNNTVIKGFGQITTSSQTSNTYNMNNETYIMIPSSYGQMKYYMKSVSDNNCSTKGDYKNDTTNDNYLENHDEKSTRTYTDDKGKTYTIDTPYYDSDYKYKNTKDTDCLEFEFDIENIKSYLAAENAINATDKISYDELAINDKYCLSSTYEFNTILVYYTIYDTNGNSLSTNLFGVMFLSSPKDSNDNNTTNNGISLSFQPTANPTTSRQETIENHITFTGNRVKRTDIYYIGDMPVNLFNDNINVTAASVSLSTNGYSCIIGGGIKTLTLYTGNQYTQTTINDLLNGSSQINNAEIAPVIAYENGKVDTEKSKTLYKITVTFEQTVDISEKNILQIYRSKTSDTLELANIEFFGVTKSNIQVLTMPSYVKKKTTAGSFGSEYSFRLNIQTASIYDKNSEITDFSTGMPGVLDDFNGVLSNLRAAVEVLTSNSILQAKIYDDFLATKTLLVSALSEIETIKQDIKNLQSQMPDFEKLTAKINNMQEEINALKNK